MDLSPVSIIGAVFALVAALAVTLEYIILVHLPGNRGAQMFFALLLTIDALLMLNAARALFGDYPHRITLLTVGFYIFGVVLTTIGVIIWKQQRQGAIDDRNRKRDRHA